MSGLFEGLTNFGPEVKAEMKRLATQGAMELANALFNGSAFVPYGPGQYTPSPAIEKAGQEQNRDGRENEGMER